MTEQNTITKAEFARRQGLARSRVSQLVALGMPVTPDGRVIEAAAARWMRDNLDAHRRQARKTTLPDGQGGRVTDLRARKLQREGDILDMEARRLAGELVDRGEAERAAFSRARFERDAWTGWPARAAQALAAEAGGDPVATLAVLDRLVREHLAELAATPMEIAPDVV